MPDAGSIIGIGLAVIKLVIILSNTEDIVTIADGTIDILDKGTAIYESEFDRRKSKRLLENMADDISGTCKSIFERANISKDRSNQIAEDIVFVLNNSGIDTDFIIFVRGKPEELRKELENKSKSVMELYDTKERELCSRIYNHISEVIVKAFLTMRDTNTKGTLQLLELFDEMRETVELTLEKIKDLEKAVSSKDADVSIFESLYRSNIIARYENINLLGATSLTRDETKYPLEIGYVSLELIGKNQTSTISIKNILKNRKNIWIIGEAGSGKSTLLQWIAINCARSNFTLIGEASNCIPILIELKNVNAGSPSLNDAIKNIMRDEGYSTPAKWLTSILKSGKAILLFDGVDEVKKEDRGKILSWIEELRGKYNEIRIVVTSRPQVEERIQENNIAEISVLPMQPKKIDEFIDYWHKAVLENKLHLKSDDIEICKEKLKKCLIKNEAVRNISSNPGMSRKMCK